MNVRLVWLLPPRAIGVRKCDYIWAEGERDAARRQTEQTLWIFIFFRWKAVVFTCSYKTEKILGSGAGIIH